MPTLLWYFSPENNQQTLHLFHGFSSAHINDLRRVFSIESEIGFPAFAAKNKTKSCKGGRGMSEHECESGASEALRREAARPEHWRKSTDSFLLVGL